MEITRPDLAVGWCLLAPGYAQWHWGQRERGLALLGTFTASLVIAAFAWGTSVGLALLALAFLTHVCAASDAIRQRSFPAPSRAVAWLGTATGLGLALYVPALALAMLVARPGANGQSGAERYLVNCWAYRAAEPQREDWVWYRSQAPGGSRVGRVIAGQGQEVSWAENVLEVDGRRVPGVATPFRSPSPPSEVCYRVPAGCVLIAPEAEAPEDRPAQAEGLTIISHHQVEGRAWARMYPIRERRLLSGSGVGSRRHGDS